MIAQTPYDTSALQVLNAAGEWISPVMEPETFVVNLGDMMSRLTNDSFLSIIHRVKNTDTRGRYSLPFFFGLSIDELISTSPQFITEENLLKEEYKNFTTGYEHYNKRMQRAHHKHISAVDKVDIALPYGMTKVDGVLLEGI
jgi:isopenicillin N synthase-like dioxygenase